MRSVNKVIIIGNLTRDPEMRQTPNGQSVTTFGLATNREWATKEGERKSSAEFHECVAWARLAEICNQFLKKGNLVYVEGYLKTRSWDSPEGIKKFKTEIVVQDMIMLEKKKDGSGDEYVPASETFGSDDSSTPEAPAPKVPAATPVEEVKVETPAEAPGEEVPAEEPKEEPKEEEKKEEEAPAAVEEAPEAPAEEVPAEETKEEENPIDKDLGL